VLGGLFLALWSARGLHLWSQTVERFDGPRDSFIIFMAIAGAALVGGILALFRVRAGKLVVIVVSWVTLLYSSTYVLLGGIDDTSMVYLIVVLSFAALALISLLQRRHLAV
jgi:hypothetical protein